MLRIPLGRERIASDSLFYEKDSTAKKEGKVTVKATELLLLYKNSNMHKFWGILSKDGILCGNMCKVIHNLLLKNGEKTSYTRSYARYPHGRIRNRSRILAKNERPFCWEIIKFVDWRRYAKKMIDNSNVKKRKKKEKIVEQKNICQIFTFLIY